jgi:hypothetical protein
MPLTLWLGLPLTLVAGLCSGSSMLPMKFAKRWPWENTWLIFTVVSLAILPWALAFTLLHDVFAVYAALPASVFIAPLQFGFGWGIAQEAVRQGASPQGSGYAVWPIALLGGLIPNAAYSCWLLPRNRTWKLFRGAWRTDVWFGCLMGVLWMGAFAVYGISSVYLGVLGTSVGWALFQIFMIMTANLSGVLTGEWSEQPV